MSDPIRLQKHIANLGICSRRKAEQLIADGKVKVNGTTAELGMKVDPDKDKISVDNQELKTKNSEFLYIVMNKPVGYITSASSEQGESVIDLLDDVNNIGRDKTKLTARVYPVGRLDKDSEGLVLLTNDGELTNKLTHPRYEHEKEYEVTIDKPLTRDTRKVLTTGMSLDEDEHVQGIKILKEFNKGRKTVVTVILKEGKNRQIRKMFGQLGYHVQSLRRIRMSDLTLGTIPVGKWKYISKQSILGYIS